jgi:uncharacterized protein
VVDPTSANYFDLEDPRTRALFEEPMRTLEPLTGLVVINEVQRAPDLFPLLRVLADRRPRPARFLILWSTVTILHRHLVTTSGAPCRASHRSFAKP